MSNSVWESSWDSLILNFYPPAQAIKFQGVIYARFLSLTATAQAQTLLQFKASLTLIDNVTWIIPSVNLPKDLTYWSICMTSALQSSLEVVRRREIASVTTMFQLEWIALIILNVFRSPACPWPASSIFTLDVWTETETLQLGIIVEILYSDLAKLIWRQKLCLNVEITQNQYVNLCLLHAQMEGNGKTHFKLDSEVFDSFICVLFETLFWYFTRKNRSRQFAFILRLLYLSSPLLS